MQPTAKLSRDDVERVVRCDYPPEQFALVIAELDARFIDRADAERRLRRMYPSDSEAQLNEVLDCTLSLQERDRLHLAALKLAAGSLDALRSILKEFGDWRDLLVVAENHWAEYQDWVHRK